LCGLLFTAPFPTPQKLLTINRRATDLEEFTSVGTYCIEG